MRLAFRRSPDSADSPPYLSLLKLHTPPFSSKAGSALFFADAERTQYLDMLQHLTQYSEEMLLVVGGEGIGKSALIDKYLERVEEHWRLCRLSGEQGLDLDTLFSRVAECFAVDLGKVEPSQLLDALRKHLDELLGMQLSVLLIDDAQALSDDALEMVLHLGALEGEGGKLIRVLLFADSSLETRLSSPRFTELAACHRIHLKPLQEADSAAYLLHRLQESGYSGPSPFSAAELKQLHHQAHGIPAQLNQLAHAMLLERTRGNGSSLGLNRNTLRYGVAATALIGTTLGLHDRINAALGGGSQSSIAMAAERPVVRLADSDNPWAVVIRDGESIQIACGDPALQSEAVRPMPAALPLSQQPAMQAPLIKPVELPPEPAEQPVTPPAAEEIPVEAEKPTEPVPKAEEPAATPPLVVKPLPSIVPPLPDGMESASEEEKATKEEPAEPEKLELTNISPTPVVGSAEPQTLTVLGTGLEPGSKVAVGWSGKVQVLEPAQIKVIDSGRMEITVTTGIEAAQWMVQVSTPSKQRSNVLRFKVEAPKVEAVKPKPKMEEKPVKATPEEKVEKKKPVPKKDEVKKPAIKKQPMASRNIQGSGWTATQQPKNFTLQLLASSERKGLDGFVTGNPSLKGPLGSFEQQKGDKRLYVLTQGSYGTRKEAEVAAKSLPAGMKPWVRDFAGIQKVMAKPSQAPATTSSVSGDGGIKDTAWVWSQNPNHHTIQLAGASDEASIEAVMHGLNLPGELAVVQTLRNGKPWYTLIYGRFADKAAAQGTVSRLPQRLREAGPWIRRFSALQGEIGQAGTTR